jgi:16S rRNA C967 or C1407 C5-methylase (RsmB/RsmF family)
MREVWRETIGTEPPGDALGEGTATLTPARHGTDGFFIAVLGKRE